MASINSNEVPGPISRTSAGWQAVLFIVPMIVTTGVSILLFSKLSGFSTQQQNSLSIVILAAVIISLLGMAGVQLLIYRFIEAPEYKDGAGSRSIKAGLAYCIFFSILISLLASPYFLIVLQLSPAEYLWFFALLIIFSATWVFCSVFWAMELYAYPALAFIIGYAAIFGFTLFINQMDSQLTLAAYVIGTAVLPVVLMIISSAIFKPSKIPHKLSADLKSMLKLANENYIPILYNSFYILAVFLDKIIVWVYQGTSAGTGLSIPGPYTIGSFLGLVPMLSVGVLAYFNSRTKTLVKDRYSGTLPDIKTKINEYKNVYRKYFTGFILITIGLVVLVNIAGFVFFDNLQTRKVLATISLGSLFLSSIIFNASALPLFGKANISTISVFAVVVFELFTIPLVASDTWYCSIGFLSGSLLGAVISWIAVVLMFRNFEYNIFRYVASISVKPGEKK